MARKQSAVERKHDTRWPASGGGNDAQHPLQAAPGSVPSGQQHVQALVTDDLRVTGLPHEGLDKDIAILLGISLLAGVPSGRRVQRLCHCLVDEAVARPAGITEVSVVEQPVKRPQTATVREVIL